jgi:hypothetical protein
MFVDDHRDAYGVKRLCHVLEVNRSSYYKWRDGAEARVARERADQELAERIRVVHAEADGAYGSPRVTAELRETGMVVNEKKVARVMRKFSIAGIRLRRKVRTTVPEPVATPVPDLFHRDFTAAEPGAKYMGDITYLPVGDGRFLYLATVLDCFSRRVVGYSIADHMRTELVADALRMARDVRGSMQGALFHSDHGAQGGFNRSSQHLDRVGGCCGSGKSAGSDSRWSAAASVAWSAAGQPTAGEAGVLAADCSGSVERRRGGRVWRVYAVGAAMVP